MDYLGRGRYGGISWIIAASVVIFILGNCQGQTDSPAKLPFKPVSIKPKPGHSAPTAKLKTTTTTTTTTVSPQVEEESEDANPAEAGESAVEGETKPPLTGDPQIDYVWDPNLPRELNGFNLSHFPFFSRVPNKMSFNCTGLIDGFYANVEYQCQVYHQCLFGIRYDFLCANYTAFDQKIFNCHFANEVDCVNSPKFFDRNEALYKTTTTTTTTLAPEARQRWRDQFIRRPPTGPATVQEGDAPPSGHRKPNSRRRPIEYDYYYDDEDYDYYDDITGSENDPTTTTTTTTTHAPVTRRHGMRRRPGAGGRQRQRGGQFRGIDGPRRRPAFDYDDETVASRSDPLPPSKQASTANLVNEPETEDPARSVADFRNTGLAAQFRPKLRSNRPTAEATDSHAVTHPPPPPTPSEAPSAPVQVITAVPSRFGSNSLRRPNHRPVAGVESEVAPIAPEILEHAQTQGSQTVPLPAKPSRAQKVPISIGENLQVETPAPKRPPFRPQNRTPSSRTTSAPAITGEHEPLPAVTEPAIPRPRQPSRITSRLTTTPPPPHAVEDLNEFVLTEEPIPALTAPQRSSQRLTSRNNARPGPQFAHFDSSFETERTVATAGPGFSRGPQVPSQDNFVVNPQPAQQGQGFRRGPQAPPSSNFPIQERDSRDIRLPVESSQFEAWDHPSDKESSEASSADSTWFPLNIYDLFHTTVR